MGAKIENWRKHGLEFLSIFIAVISAFALNNWNDNRRDDNTENKILIEIANGLEKDLGDIRGNIGGHHKGINACNYFRKALVNQKIAPDSLIKRFSNLTRDFISIQNIAGYETLKSQGLELVKNDSLRLEIISLYEYDYNTIRKLEEEYHEMQFQENYFSLLNNQLASNYNIDKNGKITSLNLPLEITESERKKLLMFLWKIESNRKFILNAYGELEKKINRVRKQINLEIYY